MEKELIIRGIRDPETARRILCAIEPDPGELRQVSCKDEVGWTQDFEFVVYEDCNKNLHTLAWYPAPSVAACIVATAACGVQYMQRMYGDWPDGLRSSTITITEDNLTDEPITQIHMCCDGEPLDLDMGVDAVMRADEALRIIKEGK